LAAGGGQPAGDEYAPPDRLAGMTGGQVGIQRADLLGTEAWGPALDLVWVDADERRPGMAQQAAAVWRVVQPRLRLFFPLVVSRDTGDLFRNRALGDNAGR